MGVITVAGLIATFASSGETARYDKAPEFPSQDAREWIGPPQSLKALAGKVVILDVWTFG